jgi:hypothetical protein
MTKNRRTLAYTPLGIRPIIHHGPPDPDASKLSLDFSPSAAANVKAVVTAARKTAARKRRRGYARTVSQKKEARRERRGASSAAVGDVRRRRHRRDDDEDDEVDEAEENNGRCDEDSLASSSPGHTDEDVIGFGVKADEDECESYDEDNDAEDIAEAIDADAVDSRFNDRGVDADTATNDDDIHDEDASAMDYGFAADNGDSNDDESSALGWRTTRAAFRSSSTPVKKRRVIRDDDSSSTQEEDERSDTNKGGTPGRECVVPARITTKTIKKSNFSDRGSLSDDGEMKDEQRDDGGDNSRTRSDRRLGRAPITTRADTDHSSMEQGDESEIKVDSTASVRKKNVSKRGGRIKLTKINEVEPGRCFFIVTKVSVPSSLLFG